MKIRNMKDLEKAVQPVMSGMVDELAERVYETLNYFLQEYYNLNSALNYNYYNATGLQVASWANKGLHGGLNTGGNTPHVWDDTMKETLENGELLNLAMDYLKSKGFSVRN